jgi:hypothetical protein
MLGLVGIKSLQVYDSENGDVGSQVGGKQGGKVGSDLGLFQKLPEFPNDSDETDVPSRATQQERFADTRETLDPIKTIDNLVERIQALLPADSNQGVFSVLRTLSDKSLLRSLLRFTTTPPRLLTHSDQLRRMMKTALRVKRTPFHSHWQIGS